MQIMIERRDYFIIPMGLYYKIYKDNTLLRFSAIIIRQVKKFIGLYEVPIYTRGENPGTRDPPGTAVAALTGIASSL